MTANPWEDPAPRSEPDPLFSRFVCRISGAPADGVEALRAPLTLGLAAALALADEDLQARREGISAALYAAIGQAGDDRAARNALIRARRELFNLRPLPASALDAACAALPAQDADDVRAFQHALDLRAALVREAEETHAEESAEARARFRALVRDEDFRKGLLVSSRSLAAALPRYAGAGGGGLSGKDEKTERGLLRYYTRMAMKATPFATFCAVVPGAFVPADEGDGEADAPLLRLHGAPRPKRSFVRINKLLYGILVDHLKERPGVRRALAVELNPTLRLDAGRLVYLTALNGREVFQRLAPNEVLELISHTFRSLGAPTLGDLIAALSADPQIEATPEEAEAYLDKLIEIGFLRFRTGIREQDADWDGPLAALLDGIGDEHAQACARLLREVRTRTDAYARAPVEAREQIIAGILALLDEAFAAMEVKGRLRKDMPFYEDATADTRAEVPLTPGVQRAADTFARWTRLTTRLGWPRSEQATMRHFFDTYYADGAPVPLLAFYEDFYREHFKAHVEKEQKARAGVDREQLKGYDLGNPFGLPFVRASSDARDALQNRIAERWRAEPGAEEVTLSLDEVEELLSGVEAQPVPCRSVSAFALLTPPSAEGGDPAFLLQGGSYTAGYGKYFSRFLYMLPDEFLAEVRAANQTLTGELLAEICGDAQFNANLHPPLLRWEISYPTGESGAVDEQLRSSDVRVERDADDPHALCLRHGPTGRRVVPVDLGFLNPRMRPPLYQLLSRFTPPVTFSPSLPDTPDAIRRKRNDPPADAAALPAPDAEAQGAGQAIAPPSVDAAEADAAPSVADAAAGDASLPDGSDAKPAEPAPEIGHRPRITVEGRVILARRRWLVPGALLPQRQADESAGAYFVRANRWRAENGLPESTYLRLIPLPDPSSAKPGDTPATEDAQEAALNVGAEAMPEPEETPVETPAAEGEGEAATPAKKVTAPSRDFFKPQFMDFGNPLLVALLGKLGNGLKRFNVIFEERLPGPGAMARAGGEAYATEMIVQLNFPEGEAGPAPATAAREEQHAGV